MNLRDALRIPSAEVTEEAVYRDRRRVLAMLGAVPALGIAGCSEAAPPAPKARVTPDPSRLSMGEGLVFTHHAGSFGTIGSKVVWHWSFGSFCATSAALDVAISPAWARTSMV